METSASCKLDAFPITIIIQKANSRFLKTIYRHNLFVSVTVSDSVNGVSLWCQSMLGMGKEKNGFNDYTIVKYRLTNYTFLPEQADNRVFVLLSDSTVYSFGKKNVFRFSIFY